MTSPVLARAAELVDRGEAHVLATVVRVDRPVSASPGDCAVVTPDGRLEGWVGGSCSEPIVVRESLRALADGSPRLVRIRPAGAAVAAAEPGVVTEVTTCASEGGMDVFVQPQLPDARLLIAGSSPAARTLASLGRVLGYRVVGVLGEPGERLPGADSTLAVDGLGGSNLGPEDAVVVASMSRYDDLALEAALETDAGYVGLVASRARGRQVLDLLAARGAAAEQLARVTTPAGLDLGPSTQDEIALAILAEVVRHRHSVRRDTAERLCPPESSPMQATDPVCGMVVASTASTPTAAHAGRTFYFCSVHCRDSFRGSPQEYVAAS